MRFLVTGTAGFIGFHVAKRLLENGRTVVGLDNLNAYYDPKLKEARRDELKKLKNFHFVQLNLADRDGMAALFVEHRQTPARFDEHLHGQLTRKPAGPSARS